MGVKKFAGIRLVGVAALVTISTLPVMYFTLIFLMLLFMEHGPLGAVEPEWAKTATIYAPIVLTSAVAGAFYDGALPARLWPHFLVGFLAGVLLVSIWLTVQLTRGQPPSALAALGYLIHPLLGASGSLLSGFVRRRRWQDYLDA